MVAGDLVRLSAAEAIRPFLVEITGPLIRIMGERVGWPVKAALLQTMWYKLFHFQ